MKDILLITPPFTQLNTPYPATAYLKGFLNTKNISSFQMDLGIEVILKLFSKNGLQQLFEQASLSGHINSDNSLRVFNLQKQYVQLIDELVSFLQGRNQPFAQQICTGNVLPQASRFAQTDDLEWAFGNMGIQDKAKHLATLFLEDLSDFIVDCVDENFGFSRYAEKIGRSANSFNELYSILQKPFTYVDTLSMEILKSRLHETLPRLVCISVPFPGNLYSAFRCGHFIKKHFPGIKIAMGGGFPNTELRTLKDVRVFEFFDYITLDEGALPIDLLVQEVMNQNPSGQNLLKRTYLLEDGKLVYKDTSLKKDYKQDEIGTADYSDLLLDKYISVIEIANPMHSLWTNGRWNKLTTAHGCYWGKCTFCDVSLNYIKAYEPVASAFLADRMEQIIAQTGEKGFHFVDEAAPPALLKALAIEILKRGLQVTWWTNIRFEKRFTADLCKLLKASGCIAVSGGLEVASDRLLALIQKGVTVEQVAQVTKNFTDAGIMVHAYLMYGFPTQTVQETVDSLEMVRQMFKSGILQSGFWHQFALTAHSPVGLRTSDFGIIPEYKEITFANNDVQFKDSTGIDHSIFSSGLKKSLYNYMHEIGFDFPLQKWFDFSIPKTSIRNDFIEHCLEKGDMFSVKPSSRIIWIGEKPLVREFVKSKKGNSYQMLEITLHTNTNVFKLSMEDEKGKWLVDQLDRLSIYSDQTISFELLKTDFENYFENFELFWYSRPMDILRDNGLLVL